MAQRLPHGYVFDPADPRAPSEEIWSRMTPDERRRVVDMLPAEVPIELHPPEGDEHREAKTRATDTLDSFFRRTGRKVYVSSELGVYYPNEPRFCPDVLAVLDVENRKRSRWMVADEGKGLDLVLEVHVAGDRAKDYRTNVERYARLGIAEYFIFDCDTRELRGHRLPPREQGTRPRAYRPILPQGGRYTSEVLGLDLMLDGTKLRFFVGTAPLLEADELIAKLGATLDEVMQHKQEAEEARRAAEEQAEALKRENAELKAEIDRLKRG